MSQVGGPSPSTTPQHPHRHTGVLAVVVLVLVAVAVVIVRVVGDDADDSGTTAVRTSVDLRNRPADVDQTLVATTGSLREFWSAELPRIYHKPFEDLAGGIQPKTEDSSPWTCNGERVTYHDIRGNAFYCGGRNDDYIAYDAAYLMPKLNESFGALTSAVVLAHEFGHAVQHRAGVNAPSVLIELQADCFAGAWVAYAQTSANDPVTVDEAALDGSIRAIPLLRDQPGTAATNTQAHGLGFDRVNAFQTGYESGADRCATFPNGNVVVTELPFRTPAELQTGGTSTSGRRYRSSSATSTATGPLPCRRSRGPRRISAQPGTRPRPLRYPAVPPNRVTTARLSRPTARPPTPCPGRRHRSHGSTRPSVTWRPGRRCPRPGRELPRPRLTCRRRGRPQMYSRSVSPAPGSRRSRRADHRSGSRQGTSTRPFSRCSPRSPGTRRTRSRARRSSARMPSEPGCCTASQPACGS